MKIKLTLDQIKSLVNEGKLPYRFLEDNNPENTEPTGDEMPDENGEEKPEDSENSVDDQIRNIKGGSILDFLKQMPKRGSFGYVYYTAEIPLNRTYVDEDGNKKPNPILGKLFKNTVFKFQFDKSYKRAVEIKNEKTGDDYQVGARQAVYKDVEGYNMLLDGPKGLYFPIVFDDAKTDQNANYMLLNDNGSFDVVSKAEIQKYLKPVSGTSTYINYRSLIVQKIFRIKAGGRTFDNPEFPYQYLGPNNLQK
jgi:hypothetical protein